MMTFVVLINRLWGWIDVREGLVGLLLLPIVSGTTKGMKSARSSRIFSWCLLSCCVLLLGLGHSEVGGLDFIDQLHPPSLKGYCFVLVVTNFFIKWTESIPLKNMTHQEARCYHDYSFLTDSWSRSRCTCGGESGYFQVGWAKWAFGGIIMT